MGRKKINRNEVNCTNSVEVFNRNDTSMIQQLNAVDEKYDKDPAVLGISALSDPCFNNSMRMCMFTSHTKQYMCLTHPDFPYYYMGSENIVGDNNDAFKSYEHDVEIIARFTKYADLYRVKNKSILPQYIIVRDTVTDEYDLIDREQAENLTEMFGYEYNNEILDGYNVGDTIPANTRVTKTTSYDEYDNYGFGQNVLTAFTLDPETYEDACVVSESLAKRLESIEIDNVTINVNSNDYPLFIKSDEYGLKILPDIGENTNGVVAAVRTLYNNQMLSDFKLDALKTMRQSDKRYYLDGEVLDIIIYCNDYDYIKERNSFNEQLCDYYESQKKFYQDFVNATMTLLHNGKKLTSNLKHAIKRAKEMLDEEMIWRDCAADKPFGGIKIDILVRKKVGLGIGQKITGRAGNKSVISRIRKDDEMPQLEDGRHVDLCLNSLAIINRTTGLPVHESSLTFACSRLIEQLKSMTKLKDKASLFFEVMDELNPDESDYLKDIYENLDTKGKNKFFNDIIADGIYIRHSTLRPHKSPFLIYRDLELKYDWMKPYKMYVNKFGRKVPCLNDAIVGYVYIMKLKQSSKKNYSARSTGAINRRSLPERSYKNKVHQELYSSTAIRFGETESLTFEIGVANEDLALFHQRYRTSIDGRKDLIHQILDPSSVVKVSDTYTNRSAEVLNVFAKTLGFQFKNIETDNIFDVYDNSRMVEYSGIQNMFFGTEWENHIQQVKEEMIDDLLDNDPNISNVEIVDIVTKELTKQFGNDIPLWDIEDIANKLRYDVIDY